MQLSVIIPCYNEENNVKLIYDEIVKNFKSIKNYELIFVNDGSKDKTFENLKKLGSNNVTNIKIINFSRNFGKEAAMYAGLKESIGNYVSIIDADMQQDPKLILKMIKFLEENEEYDSVAMCQKKRNEKLSVFKKAFYKFINKISSTTFVDGASDFRIFKRNMVNSILELKEYSRFSKGIFSWVGYNTYYMEYVAGKRATGETSWSFTKLFKYALDGIISFTTTPLKLPFICGCFTSVSLLLYILFSIFLNLSIKINILILTILLLINSIFILFSLAIISEYIAKTYLESKNRPIYIIKEKIEVKRGKND